MKKVKKLILVSILGIVISVIVMGVILLYLIKSKDYSSSLGIIENWGNLYVY